VKFSVWICVTCAAAGCGAAPLAAPTQTIGHAVLDAARVSRPLALSPGPYWLQIYGHAISDHPDEPVCTPAGVPAQGTFVNALVRVERAALNIDGWVALSVPGEGTVEFHFAQTGIVTGSGDSIVGTISGVSRDSAAGTFRPATNVSVTLRGFPEEAAAVRGVAGDGTFLYGAITGRVAFSDPSGASSGCRLVYWTLQPMPATAGAGVEISGPSQGHLLNTAGKCLRLPSTRAAWFRRIAGRSRSGQA
jgi:hypothetical protein